MQSSLNWGPVELWNTLKTIFPISETNSETPAATMQDGKMDNFALTITSESEDGKTMVNRTWVSPRVTPTHIMVVEAMMHWIGPADIEQVYDVNAMDAAEEFARSIPILFRERTDEPS